MGLFDLFTFKKEGKRIFTKENFLAVLELAKKEIIKQRDCLEKKGAEKKAAVDAVVTSKIKELKATCKNKYIIWVLNEIIDFIPKLTQFLYDCLKAQFEKL